jgi:hypothetical protein
VKTVDDEPPLQGDLLAVPIGFHLWCFKGLKRIRWKSRWLITRAVNLALMLTMLRC